MEGLIPLVYKAIVQYRNGGQSGMIGTWLDDAQSSSPAYMRLPGDSGRFAASNIHIFRQDYGFTACSPPRSAAERAASTAGQRHLISSRRAVK